jgi:hypothetical protein
MDDCNFGFCHKIPKNNTGAKPPWYPGNWNPTEICFVTSSYHSSFMVGWFTLTTASCCPSAKEEDPSPS